jgi:hypothetical protein
VDGCEEDLVGGGGGGGWVREVGEFLLKAYGIVKTSLPAHNQRVEGLGDKRDVEERRENTNLPL